MIIVKSEREIELMRRAGKITAAARALAGEMVRPGVTTKAIDKAVHDYIVSQGATPSFLHYSGYPASVCISVNNTVIHGIPDGRVLQVTLSPSMSEPNGRDSMGTAPQPMPAGRSLPKRRGLLMSRSRAFSRA